MTEWPYFIRATPTFLEITLSIDNATVTIIYDDLTSAQPSHKTVVLNRLEAQRRIKNQLIDAGQSSEALEFEFTADDFRDEILQLAGRTLAEPFMFESDDDGFSMLSPSQVLRVDVKFGTETPPVVDA